MDGRAQDAAPQGARRAARPSAATPSTTRGRRSARHRAHRSAGGQSLSLRGDRGEGRALRGVRREHRHRRSGDDPRRRQEPRCRHGRGRCRRTTPTVLAEMAQHGGATSLALRKALAAKAYARTAAYDAAISGWFAEDAGRARARAGAPSPAGWRRSCATARTRTSGPPSMCRASAAPGVATAVQHQGKELSYNNLDDTDAAFELVAEFDPQVSPAVAIIKHANPCGVALGATLAEAYAKALALRPRQRLRRHHRAQRPDRRRDGRARSPSIFTEVVIAPDATRRGQGDLRRQEEPAAADHGRPARSARARASLPLARRRLPRAVARQRAWSTTSS